MQQSRAGSIVYHEYLRGNTAIVGPETWHEDDRLKCCTFSVEGTDDQLHNNPRFETLLRAVSDEKPSTEVLSLQIGDATISVYYAMSSNRIFNRAPELRPRFAIEFAAGRTLWDTKYLISSIVEFLSASQSRELIADDIKIYRSTLTELKNKLQEFGDFPYHYSVHTFKHEPATKLEYQFFAKSFAYLREDPDMELFKACLKQWLSRGEDWREASALMVASFKLAREMSGARLLAATRWVECIPGNAAAGNMLDEHFAEIVRVAAARAEEFGHKGLEGRIKGSLRSLKSETNRQRLERLVARGMTVLDPLTFEAGPLVTACMFARDFRGKAAHGRVIVKSEQEETEFELAVLGTECLAYLLMLADLPLDEEARRRVNDANPISHFRMTWRSSGIARR
ncbi:hypothetical protein HT136_22390 [Novosphingobium profundi]|uniref:hypothetical protein n=1 Tax=Novosphingobium profundi TaxID=1774954 RepID=UPI001BDAE059|nr:hypothetical protein [Novosphingobium profundi]MBT0671126.1 hypothetical protein [Novosphingobium profundi]